jgi:hypothetical protein
MTAEQVNGIAVVGDAATLSPHIRDRAGNPLVWHRTRTLTLADGTTTYGCSECDYTSDNMYSIRPHLSAHRTMPRRPRRPVALPVDPGALSLADLLSRVDQLAKVEADRDAWRTRAQGAERSLATLRRALRP